NQVTGPWPEGPIVGAVVPIQHFPNGWWQQQLILTNTTERRLDIDEVSWVVGVSDVPAVAPPPGLSVHDPLVIHSLLPPKGSLAVPMPTTPYFYTQFFVSFTVVPGDPTTLTEVRAFVEDVNINVLFLNLVNFGNHGLKALSIQARLQGVEGTHPVSVSEDSPT